MRVGIISATPEERAELADAMTAPAEARIAGAHIETGTLDGIDVALADAGFGKVNAAIAATLLVDRFLAGALVLSGVAGGLDPALAIGDVVVAERVVVHDAGVIEEEGLRVYQPGHMPFLNPTSKLGYDADRELLRETMAAIDGLDLPPLSAAAGGGDKPKVVAGTVVSGAQYVNSESTRMRLHALYGGAAVEMEGGSVAQVAEAFGVPWLVISSLSDLAGRESAFDFSAFLAEASASSAAVVRRALPAVAAQRQT